MKVTGAASCFEAPGLFTFLACWSVGFCCGFGAPCATSGFGSANERANLSACMREKAENFLLGTFAQTRANQSDS